MIRSSMIIQLDEPAAQGMESVKADPRHMTPGELRSLGIPAVVYLTAGCENGQPVYFVHAADGTRLAVVEDIELAVELASASGMTFAAVH